MSRARECRPMLRVRIAVIALCSIFFAVAVSDGIIWMMFRHTLMNEAKQTILRLESAERYEYQEYFHRIEELPNDLQLQYYYKQKANDYIICLRGEQEIHNQTILAAAAACPANAGDFACCLRDCGRGAVSAAAPDDEAAR